MNGKNWQELDFKIASDYTHGSPEYHRSRLRQILGLPIFLPGEKGDFSTKRHHSSNPSKVSRRGNVPGIFYKGQG